MVYPPAEALTTTLHRHHQTEPNLSFFSENQRRLQFLFANSFNIDFECHVFPVGKLLLNVRLHSSVIKRRICRLRRQRVAGSGSRIFPPWPRKMACLQRLKFSGLHTVMGYVM